MSSWDRPRISAWRLGATFMLRTVVFLSVIGALGWSLFEAIERSEQAPSHVEELDERYLSYVLRAGQGPAFSMGQLSPRLRVLSWGHLPEGVNPATYDRERRYFYGLRFRVLDEAGSLLDTHDVWLRSRVSRRPAPNDGWAERAAYYPVGQGESDPTDTRLVEVDLSAWDGPGRRVDVELIDTLTETQRDAGVEPGDILLDEAQVVVFRHFEREAGEREWQGRTMSERRRAELAGRARLDAWTDPTAAEIDRMLVGGWRRDTTLGEAEVRALYTSDFRFEEFDEVALGELLPEGEALAFALEGPVRLYAARVGEEGGALRAEIARTAESEPGVPSLSFSTVEQDVVGAGEALADLRPLEDAANATLSVFIEDGESAAVQLYAPGGARLAVWVDRAEGVAGEPEVARSADGRFRILPDRRRFATWEARRADATPVVFRLRRGDQRLGDALMLTLRHLPNATGQLRYRFVGAPEDPDDPDSGVSMAEGEVPLQGETSPFERLVDAEHLRELERVAPDPEALLGYDPLAEPTSHRFWIPQDAERLELFVDSPTEDAVWIGASVLALAEAGERAWEVPYDRVPELMRWRYAPTSRSAWIGIWPDNAEALTLAGRRAMAESQARWEPRWNHEQAREVWAAAAPEARLRWQDVWDASDVQPPERATQREDADALVLRPTNDLFGAVLLERVDPAELDASQPWEPTWRAEFGTQGRLACRPAAGSDTLSVEYRVPDALVGRTVELRWQGATVRRQRLLSTTGRLSALVGQARGTLSLHLATESGDASAAPEDAQSPAGRWWADCEPTRMAAQTLWRQRRVHRLARGRDLIIEAESSLDQQRYVNVVAYLERPSAQVATLVDGGDPGGRAGQSLQQITAPEQRFTLEASSRSATLVGGDGRTLYGPVRIAVPLGSDWSPGTHRIRLRLEDGATAWVRFFQIEE